jgi:membrane associated rhomboid family serine protease
MGKYSGAIPILLIANVVIFAVSSVPDMKVEMRSLFALYFPQNENFKYWQFVTSMFMHGGFAHILFNMYALWAFGSPLERMWGKSRFLFFYFLSGIGAGIIYILINYFQFNAIYNNMVSQGISIGDIQRLLETGQFDNSVFASFSEEKLQSLWNLYNVPVVGASGAIYGVLVAFGILFPNSKLMLIFLPFPIAAKYFIPILIALDLFSGITGFSIFGGGVAHFGHVGGAIIGFLLMWYWRKRNPKHTVAH